MVRLDIGNAASGAVSGAYMGSAGGPLATAGGAILGGITSLFRKKKKKKQPKTRSTLDPQQQTLYNDYIDSLRGEGPMADLYQFDEAGYNDVFDKTIGRPAYRNFQENIIPGITGQYRQGGLMNSSYSGEALSRAGRDVQEGLDAQRSANIFSGQQQARRDRASGIENALNRQTVAYERPEARAPSGIDQILQSVGPQAGQWLADQFRRGGTASPTTANAVA